LSVSDFLLRGRKLVKKLAAKSYTVKVLATQGTTP